MRTVVAVCNDLHVGSPFAVCPARWLLQSGNVFTPNEMQNAILAHWCACWQRVAQLRKGARLVVLVVGDTTEGLHHGSSQHITPRLDEQEAMAIAVIESALKLGKWRNRGDCIRFVAGTAAHDGEGSQSLERIARNILDVDANDGTRCVTDSLRISVNGVRFDVAHKPGSGPGSRTQTHGNAFGNWLRSLYLAGLEEGAHPRYVLTAHHHQYLRRDVYTLRGSVALTGFILPSWKVKDSYVYTVAPFALASVGMLAFDVQDDGRVTEYDMRIPITQDTVEEL
jgi:hypothetical protein